MIHMTIGPIRTTQRYAKHNKQQYKSTMEVSRRVVGRRSVRKRTLTDKAQDLAIEEGQLT